MRLLTLLLLLSLPLCATAQEKFEVATLTVHGEAVTKRAPDQVTLPVTVSEEDADLKTAKSRHDNKLSALLKRASDRGIDKDHTQTNYTSVNPLYDYNRDNSTPHLRGYQVQTSVNFKLDDIARLGEFMNEVIALNISTIGSVSYSLKDEEKVKEDTLNHALENAYAKASRLATTAKVVMDRPVSIQEGDAQIERPPVRPLMMRAMAKNDAMSPPELPAGLIEIRQGITVTYAIK